MQLLFLAVDNRVEVGAEGQSVPFLDAAETVFWMNNWRDDDLPTDPGLHGDRGNRCRKENDNGDLVILGAYYSITARHESTACQARPLAFNAVNPGHVHLSAASRYMHLRLELEW